MHRPSLWTEDFESGTTNWSLNVSTGTNDTDANIWTISDDEGGEAAGNCGTASNGDNTLHVTCQGAWCFGTGAAYNAGDGGIGYIFATTSMRAEYSTAIVTTGQTNLSLTFNWIGVGETGDDFATLQYSVDGGTNWVDLQTYSGGATCGSGQGLWTAETVALPVACENQADLRFAFNWENSNNGVGSDPSFAVNDMELITSTTTTSVTADFTQDNSSPICEGTTVTFTDNSTESGTTITSWAWTFNGGDVTSASTQGPHSITFNTAGTYDIELQVSDGTLSDTYTTSLTVNAAAAAGADGSSNLCNNTTLDLSTLLSGADAGGTWTETSTTPSGQLSGSVLDGNGLTAGDVFTFVYTVTGTAPCADDVSDFTITIIDCSAGTPPTAAFTASQTTLCVGDCITFTDNSTPGDITNWAWDFDGGATNASTQDPGSVCFDSEGVYDVTLTVTNPYGTDNATIQITVNALPTVTATASPSTTLCTGDDVTLTGAGATNYSWDNGVSNGVAFTTTSAGSTTYTLTGTDANGCVNTSTVTLNVTDCDPLLAGFEYQDNICEGSCLTFTDTSSGNVVSWYWDFGTQVNPVTSTDQNPENICFDTAGVYNIQLTITDAGGASASTTNQITVFESPTVTAENDTLIDLAQQAPLLAIASESGGSYLWSPTTYYIDCDTCASTYAIPELTTDYIVVYTSDITECTATDTVHVEVNFIEGVGVPTAFSPNADGNNDVLYVKGYGISKMSFRVYNRFGQLVFESTDQDVGWDGQFKGKDENPGVFVWILTYELENGSTGEQTGNTTLIR